MMQLINFYFIQLLGEANAIGRAWLQDIVLRIPTHELNSEPSVKFLTVLMETKK